MATLGWPVMVPYISWKGESSFHMMVNIWSKGWYTYYIAQLILLLLLRLPSTHPGVRVLFRAAQLSDCGFTDTDACLTSPYERINGQENHQRLDRKIRYRNHRVHWASGETQRETVLGYVKHI